MNTISFSDVLTKKELCKKEQGILCLYVQIPFCASICGYCCWMRKYASNEVVAVSKYREPYLAALKREIRAKSRLSYEFPNHINFKVIHFGGGTPSLLQPKEIASILNTILFSYGVALDDIPTIGIEIRPGNFSLDDLRFLKGIGFNRVSLGVQSFDQSVLDGMGRKGTVKQIYRSYDLIRNSGFQDVNIDLLYGFPFQTFDQWKRDVDAAIALHPEHIDAHPWLYIDDHRWSEEIKLEYQQEQETEKRILWTQYLRQRLTESGYSNYNHRCFCMPGKENMMHLVEATYCLPFVSFGAGAEYYNKGLPDKSNGDGAKNTPPGSIKDYVELDFSTQRYKVPERLEDFSLAKLIATMSRQLVLPEGIDLPFTGSLCCCDVEQFLDKMRDRIYRALQEVQYAESIPEQQFKYMWRKFKRILNWIEDGKLEKERDYLRFREREFPLEKDTWFLYME